MARQGFRQFLLDRRKSLAGGALVLIVGASVAIAATQKGESEPQGAFSADPQRAKVEQIVRDYILAHPEIIQEAADLLRDKQLAKVVDDNRALFETPFGSAWAGAEKGDVVLVEFFDYACGYCRASKPDIERLLKEDKGLKVVWRELPVLGEDSVAAAHASLAAAKQGRFRQFHDRLFASGAPSASTIAEAQKAVGSTLVQSAEFDQEIAKNLDLARAIQVSGTPAFVVGGKVFQGAVGYDKLKQAIADVRARS